MADGSVKIDITADDSDIKKKLKGVEDSAEDAADELDDLGDSLDDLGDSAKKPEKGFKLLDGVISSFVGTSLNDLAGKALEIIGNLAALSDETREYREDMAKLEAGFKSAGHSTETAQKAYDGFYKLLGESDRSVEAVNHLAELTTNTEEVAKWTDIAAGVTAKFGDSLPIEGLTEAANETAKVGAVTGPLADALNWAGISEDAFNEKLAACNSEQERATLITNTLSAEYQAAAAEYNELTASTQAAREATNRMEQAQANLGAVMEPLTTWWTNAKASMLSWAADGVSAVVDGITTLNTNTDVLTEKQRALVDQVSASAEAYRETKEAAAELAAAQLADVGYATETLLPQLQALVDSNGNVKKGYEERAAFIMGQLNQAFGTEYTRISEIIGANGQLTKSIKDTILAKQAEILLSERQSSFEVATKEITAEQKKRDDLMSQIAAQIPIYEEAERRKQEVYAETAKAFQSGVESQVRQASIKRSKVDAEFNSEKKALDDLNEAYNNSGNLIETYNSDIEVYTEATTLMMQGKTAEAVGYLQNLNAGYKETGSQAQKTAEEQKQAVEDRLTNAAITLGLLQAEYEASEASMTEAQKTEMQNRIAAAQKEVEELGAEAQKLGSNLVEGIGVGADGKSDWLSGKLGGIVSKAIEAAKKVGIIKSPSRKTRDEVGIPLVQGIAVGIERAADEPAKAFNTVFDSMDDLLEKRSKEQIKTISDCNKECAKENAGHIDNLIKLEEDSAAKRLEIDEKYAEDKAAKNAELAKLEEKYIEDKAAKNSELAKLAEKHAEDTASKNKELTKLDEKLTEDKKKKNADLAELDKEYAENTQEANADLAKLNKEYAEDKKKKNADLVKIDKEYKEKKEKLNADLVKIEKEYGEDILKTNTDYDVAVEKEKERHVQALEKIEEEKHEIISSKMQELVDLGETYKENTKKLWEDLDKSISDLQANYDNQLASRTKSIADSLNLWSEATKNAPSIHTLTNNLKSQVSVLESYNEAIAMLESRNVSAAFIQQLKELGVGSTGEIQAIARMTDKQLESYVALWEEKNALAHDAALEELEPLKAETEAKIQELTGATMLKYTEMRAKFKAEGALLAEELKQDMIAAGLEGYEAIQGQIDTYTESGVALMDGVVQGVITQSPVLSQAVTTAVNNAIAAAKAAAGIASPSKVMKKEVGANLAEGVNVGWADKIANIKDKMAVDMQGITARIKAVVSAENARMAQGVGVRDTGFTEVAHAVGMQTAGINSLASEYRRGSNTKITVPLIIDSRELGHAIIDLGSIESERLGTNVVFG